MVVAAIVTVFKFLLATFDTSAGTLRVGSSMLRTLCFRQILSLWPVIVTWRHSRDQQQKASFTFCQSVRNIVWKTSLSQSSVATSDVFLVSLRR